MEEGEGGPDAHQPPRMDGEGAEEGRGPVIPVSAVVLVSVGGMLLFLGLSFLLIAGLGVGGFRIPAALVIAIAAVMMMLGWNVWRRARIARSEREMRERDRLLCDYCGGQNAEGAVQCQFCGAPLR